MAILDRRTALALAGGLVATAAFPAAKAARATGGVLLFEPACLAARNIAQAAFGRRLLALTGDPVSFWREHMTTDRGPVEGATRWSDYVLLRALAEDQGLRLRQETFIANQRAALTVHWSMA